MSYVPYRSGRGVTVTIGGSPAFCAANCRVVQLPDFETFLGEAQTQNGVEVFGDLAQTESDASPQNASKPALTKFGQIKFDYPDDDTVPGALCTGLEVTLTLTKAGVSKSAKGHVSEDGGAKADPNGKDGMVRSCTFDLHQQLQLSGTAGSPSATVYRSGRGYTLTLTTSTPTTILSLANYKMIGLPVVKCFTGEVQTGSKTSFGEMPIEVPDDNTIESAVLTGEELTLTMTHDLRATITGLGHLTKSGGAKADPSGKDGMVRGVNFAMHGLLTYTPLV